MLKCQQSSTMEISQALDSTEETNSAPLLDARIKVDDLTVESKMQDNFNLTSPRIRSPRRSPGLSPGGTTKLDLALDSLVARLTASVTASVSPHVKAECRRAVEARVSPLLQGSPRSPSSSSDGLRSEFSNTPRSPLRSPPYLSPGTLFTFDETPSGASAADVNGGNRDQMNLNEEDAVEAEAEEEGAVPTDSEDLQLPQPPSEDTSSSEVAPAAQPVPGTMESPDPSLPVDSSNFDGTAAPPDEMATEKPRVVRTLQISATSQDAGAPPFSPTTDTEAFGVVEENQASDQALVAVPTDCWSSVSSSANVNTHAVPSYSPSPASPTSTVSESSSGSGEGSAEGMGSSPSRRSAAWPSVARVNAELGPTSPRLSVRSPRLSLATATPTTSQDENPQAYWALKACVEAAAEVTVDASANFELKFDALTASASNAQAAAQQAHEGRARAEAKCTELEAELAVAYKDARHADAHHTATVAFLQDSSAAELEKAKAQIEAATQRALQAEAALRAALDEVATVKAQHEKTTHMAQNHIEFLEGQLAARDQEVKQQAADLAVLRYAAEDGMKATMRDAVAGAAEALGQQQQQQQQSPSPSRRLDHHVTFRSPLSSPSPPSSPASPPDVSAAPVLLQPALRAPGQGSEGGELATDESSSSSFTFGGGGGDIARSPENFVAVAAKELLLPKDELVKAEDDEIQPTAQSAVQAEVERKEPSPLPISETVSSEADAALEVNVEATQEVSVAVENNSNVEAEAAADAVIETVIEAAIENSCAEATAEVEAIIETVIEAATENSGSTGATDDTSAAVEKGTNEETAEEADAIIETDVEVATENSSSTGATDGTSAAVENGTNEETAEEANAIIETDVEIATDASCSSSIGAVKEAKIVIETAIEAATNGSCAEAAAEKAVIAVAGASDELAVEFTAESTASGLVAAGTDVKTSESASADAATDTTATVHGADSTDSEDAASELQPDAVPTSVSNDELPADQQIATEVQAPPENNEDVLDETLSTDASFPAVEEIEKTEDDSKTQAVIEKSTTEAEPAEEAEGANVEAEVATSSNEAEGETTSSAETETVPSTADAVAEELKPSEATLSLEGMKPDEASALVWSKLKSWAAASAQNKTRDEGGEGGVVSLFKELDLDNSGTLDAKEFKAALAAMGLPGASNKVVETVMKAAALADGSKGSKKVLDYASFAMLLDAP